MTTITIVFSISIVTFLVTLTVERIIVKIDNDLREKNYKKYVEMADWMNVDVSEVHYANFMKQYNINMLFRGLLIILALVGVGMKIFG